MQDEGKRKTAKAAIEAVASSNKFKVLGWRLVPTKPAVLVCLHVYIHARTHTRARARTHTHSKFKVLGWRIYG
jgi:flavin reductase (DIM6/NTAB) family NADH-FMN oxidoreductase RutF